MIKLLNLKEKYLKVNALAPIILAKQLKKAPFLLLKLLIRTLTLQILLLSKIKSKQRFYSFSEAMMIQEAFKYHGVDQGEILNIGPKYQSLLRQLGNIKRVRY